MHKVEIPSWAVERALARRGRLHPFDVLDPTGIQAAETIGIEPRRLLKTLMVSSTASRSVSSSPQIVKSA